MKLVLTGHIDEHVFASNPRTKTGIGYDDTTLRNEILSWLILGPGCSIS